MENPRLILQEIGLNESEVDVYLAMRQGIVRVQDIMKVTSRKRPTVYYAIDSLEKRGLVNKTGSTGDGSLRLAPLQRLFTIVEEKKRKTDDLLIDLGEMVAREKTQKSGTSERPSVAFYEGVDAVKNIIMETLYCRDKTIDVVAPSNNFFWQIGPDFVEKYVDLRGRRGIKTRSLWENPTDPRVYKRYYKGLSDIRLLPTAMKGQFLTTTFLYDDKVLSISSLKNGYCIVITSREYHDTMRAWFNGLWGASKNHPTGKKK